jgi:hypothetical protein
LDVEFDTVQSQLFQRFHQRLEGQPSDHFDRLLLKVRRHIQFNVRHIDDAVRRVMNGTVGRRSRLVCVFTVATDRRLFFRGGD